MNGYVLGGYIVVLGAIGLYAVSLVERIRSARRRVRVIREINDRAKP